MTETAESTNFTSDDRTDVPGAQALMRGLDVLMAIGMAQEPPRFREVHAAVKLPKGTLHRLLAALQRRRLVRYDERTRQYHVGSRVFELARRTLDQSAIIRAAKPELSRIARKLSRPVCLHVIDGEEMFVIDFEDLDAAQARMVRMWPRQSMIESAAGLAMIAAMPNEQRQLFLRRGEKSGLELDVGLGQALGYTILEQNGLPTVASAILDDTDYPLAAISCPIEGNAVPAEFLHEAGRVVAEGARRASGNMAAPLGAPAVLPTPPSIPDPRVRDLQTGRDYMGENPVWCAKRQKAFWLDILAPALRSYDPATGKTDRYMLPEITGGLALRDKDLILLGQHGLFSFDPDTQRHALLVDPEKDKPDNRFNTAAVAPDGAIWAATMALNHRPDHGALYRIAPSLSVRRILDKVGLPKNVAWSPDGETLFFSDGHTGVISAFDVNTDNHELINRRVFASGGPEIGMPNGIAVDSDGYLWAAMLGGWAINRYAPDGDLIDTIRLPVPMPTSLCFGGSDLKTLFITSTYLRLPPGFSTIAPLSGNLLAVEVECSGQPARLFGKMSRAEEAKA